MTVKNGYTWSLNSDDYEIVRKLNATVSNDDEKTDFRSKFSAIIRAYRTYINGLETLIRDDLNVKEVVNDSGENINEFFTTTYTESESDDESHKQKITELKVVLIL